MRPRFEEISLLIIDVQERLMGAMPEDVGAAVTRNIDILADLIQQLGGTLIYTEQYPKGLGATVEGVRAHLKGAMRLEKISFSCLDDERFVEQALPTLTGDVIVVGMEAHVCVLQTVMDLLEEAEESESDRMVYVPMDAVCSRAKQNWRNGVDQMYESGAVVTNTETLVFQALGEAGSDVFKHFSRRLK